VVVVHIVINTETPQQNQQFVEFISCKFSWSQSPITLNIMCFERLAGWCSSSSWKCAKNYHGISVLQ